MSRAQNQHTHRREFRRKLLIVCALFGFYGFAIVAKLFYLQVIKRSELVSRAEKQYMRTVKVFYDRGKIFDRNGSELAANLEMESVYVHPGEVRDKRQTARMLARVLGREFREIFGKLKSNKNFVWVMRKVDPKKAQNLKQLRLPGVGFVSEQKRFYPKRELASGVMGFVGLDNQGLAGAEHYHDSVLRGMTSLRIMKKDALGRSMQMGSKGDDFSRASDVFLSIDEVIQFIAEFELSRQVDKFKAKAGLVIVMDPNTGEIYAMANVPQFNPNSYASYAPELWRNPNISSSYEPGSTFKPIVAAAVLESGMAKPNDIFFCENGSYLVGSTRIGEASNHRFGWLTLAGIIEKSSNIGAIKIAEKLGQKRLHDFVRRFGFGKKSGVRLPGESGGQLRDLKDWSKLSASSISFGHEIGATPIQMISAVSAIANGGNLMHPLIAKKFTRGGETLRTFEPVRVTRAISLKTSRQMVEILKAVVRKGTGKKAAVSGYDVAGKTGTAQKYDRKVQAYSDNAYMASFVGFVPADSPRLAILVMIDEPKGVFWGGDVAAPVFRRIARRSLRYLNVPPRGEKVFILNPA
tara:strand:- start:1542 stop:3278 length:1737 start_codon:yes stop_codon:yes gene_type:complete